MTPAQQEDVVQLLKMRMMLEHKNYSCTQAVNEHFGYPMTTYSWSPEERQIFDALYRWRYRSGS